MLYLERVYIQGGLRVVGDGVCGGGESGGERGGNSCLHFVPSRPSAALTEADCFEVDSA